MIKAVLFDCDGLMFETERISIAMWKKYATEYNVVLPDDFFTRITGGRREEDDAYIQSIAGIQKIRPILAKKRFDLDYWRSFQPDSLNKKGLLCLFGYLKQNGYKIAICSSSPKTYVETLLQTVSVPLTYDALICGDMVLKTKPDPEIFLTAADVLQVHKEDCLVLEDSKMGILAAVQAGMHRCWIPDMIEADEQMLEAIEARCDNLSQVIALLEEMNKEQL